MNNPKNRKISSIWYDSQSYKNYIAQLEAEQRKIDEDRKKIPNNLIKRIYSMDSGLITPEVFVMYWQENFNSFPESWEQKPGSMGQKIFNVAGQQSWTSCSISGGEDTFVKTITNEGDSRLSTLVNNFIYESGMPGGVLYLNNNLSNIVNYKIKNGFNFTFDIISLYTNPQGWFSYQGTLYSTSKFYIGIEIKNVEYPTNPSLYLRFVYNHGEHDWDLFSFPDTNISMENALIGKNYIDIYSQFSNKYGASFTDWYNGTLGTKGYRLSYVAISLFNDPVLDNYASMILDNLKYS